NKVLSNVEIQAMITAIGTGIGDEFDIAALRYHRIVVMTDADVDGSHIRTLVLTFLYRHMKELFERGHIYIAVAPLYKVKLGNQEFYFEKESQLEDLLVRERFSDLAVQDREGNEVKLTEARWKRYTSALAEFEGWLARLRSDFGNHAADAVVSHRLVEFDALTPAAVETALNAMPANGFTLSVLERDEAGLSLKIIEKETSAAQTIVLSAELFSSPIYANLRKAYARLVEVTGPPPFTLTLGKKSNVAQTFSALRDDALNLAKEAGIQLSRYKGLGEMNADQLWDTTMDPSKRLLVRVDVEDAHAADLLFSMLMGEQVEPRRLFIEENAKDVKFLDV
ncbi:MAG TPA: toprim domain-containing protein, partial [Gaiellaceae bacterium]|nr:toprim domain-containing protein [Gaiellaceae bacterium]